MIQEIRSYLGRSVMGRITRRFPVTADIFIPRPWFPAHDESLDKTLLITCSKGFNQNFPKAATLMREGFARGWAENCGPAKLIRDDEVIREIELHDNPAVFMSEFEFGNISNADAKKLRDADLFVWVGVHPQMSPQWERLVLTNPASRARSLAAYPKILLAEPMFVWNSFGNTAMEWYQGWCDDGLKWETIYPAVDEARYFPDPAPEKYGHIRMAYVGGYWEEKAQAFDRYFRPWEDIFVPFGYEKWPYRNYAGQINEQDERRLYTSAGLIPLVTSPGGWLLAEITERYLKAPACKAFCIADQNPALREIFSDDEMIQAECPEHFHELVREYLSGDIDTQHWREKACRAVQERHLYSHRALQIKKALSG